MLAENSESALIITRVEKIPSENLRLRSALEVIQRSVSDGGNLCPLWLEILKSL